MRFLTRKYRDLINFFINSRFLFFSSSEAIIIISTTSPLFLDISDSVCASTDAKCHSDFSCLASSCVALAQLEMGRGTMCPNRWLTIFAIAAKHAILELIVQDPVPLCFPIRTVLHILLVLSHLLIFRSRGCYSWSFSSISCSSMSVVLVLLVTCNTTRTVGASVTRSPHNKPIHSTSSTYHA